MDIGKKIREIRKSKNITLQELANKINVATQTIQKYETGIIKDIPLSQLNKLADVLNVSIIELITSQDFINDTFYSSINSELIEDKPVVRYNLKTNYKNKLITNIADLMKNNINLVKNKKQTKLIIEIFDSLFTLDVEKLEDLKDFIEYLKVKDCKNKKATQYKPYFD